MPRYRTQRRTTTTAAGVKVVKTKLVEAPILEWRLQAESVRQIRAMPDYDITFSIAGDFNAARRSPQESVKAKATGLTPGESDLRCYVAGGHLGMIEYKGKNGRLSPAQVERHALLRSLGFEIVVIKAATPEQAAAASVEQVKQWLAQWVPANDNERRAA